ncbi:MAG TPA: cation:proton antiporter [Acidimicrobiia bacterium]|nr:cation:proton antiporter [Acidimicrobiia bacterium]
MEVFEGLTELLVILIAAKVGAEVMARLRQPAVIGELLIGAVIGAGVLGWVGGDDGGLLSTLAEIGVILLLFEVGLETDLRSFARLGASALTVAVVGVVTPFALGFFAVRLFSIGGGSTELALFMGAAMTATSVGITARVFADLRRLHTDEAKTIIGAAVIDDVLGLIILGVVAAVLGGDGEFSAGTLLIITAKAVGFLVVVVAVGHVVAPYFFRFVRFLKVEGSFVVGSFVFAIAVGLAAEHFAGLEPIVGAFAAGLVAGQTSFADRIEAELRPISFLFVPIFFLFIGSRVDVVALSDPQVLLAGGIISFLAIVGKLVAGLGVLSKGVSRRVVGVGMVPRGEVGLIFAALGAGELSAVVGAGENAIVVLMVVVTTLLAPLILNRMLRNEPLDDERAAEDRTVVSMGKILDSPVIGSAEQDASKRDATED